MNGLAYLGLAKCNNARPNRNALKSTAEHYPNGALCQHIGRYQTSFDKGTGLVDAVAAASALGAHPDTHTTPTPTP